ncbi:MAG: hypothetical protein FWG97_00265 [Deltaproteobacteria bacterium]|nr:hypothetical protein [Deltaproteobacteria bacterium]
MNVTLEQAERLLKGSQTFSQLGFSMMLTRHRTLYAKNPSPSTVQTCASEINVFLEKFKALMGQDYSVISKM